MQPQLFDVPRAAQFGESGLPLAIALILSYFLLSAALMQEYSRSSPPPLAGQTTIIVRSR